MGIKKMLFSVVSDRFTVQENTVPGTQTMLNCVGTWHHVFLSGCFVNLRGLMFIRTCGQKDTAHDGNGSHNLHDTDCFTEPNISTNHGRHGEEIQEYGCPRCAKM